MMRLLQRIIDASTRQPWWVIAGVLAWLAFSIFATTRLRFDAFPDLTNVQVQAVTASPGMDSREIESLVTAPLERALSGVPGVVELRSLSRTGISSITVVFEEGTDIHLARQWVSQRLPKAREAIPERYGAPELGPLTTGLGEIFQFEVRADRMCSPGEQDLDGCYTLMELRTILDWYVAVSYTHLRAHET